MLKDKSQKPTKKLSLKTLTLKELKQVNGGVIPISELAAHAGNVFSAI